MSALLYSGLGGRPGKSGAVHLAPNGMLSSGSMGRPAIDGFVKLNINGVPASLLRKENMVGLKKQEPRGKRQEAKIGEVET